MKIAVAGGTGAVGAHVVELAREAGHEVVVLSRGTGVDLVEGTGLAAALAGVEAVVDVASTFTLDAEESRAFFGTTTRRLLEAEAAAGTCHHLALSIVGIDDAPHGYYAGKVLQEELVAAGPGPWTVLRATQFHEFAGQVHGQTTVGPLVLVPRMRSETVAARDVAARLVELVEAGPSGRVADLGGPETAWMADLSRAWARARGDERRVLGVPLPGRLGKAMRDGTLVSGVGADHGTTTFEQWLEGQVVERA
ncbi:SDR family oxidoreductase [Aeromicrobium sp. Leaf350]|uniref:SDR family oxidoreductase n=1 Tax=Aeromicrobium sp. Leaf350 TaxID=2876565 RepID=UPI001E2D332E|nr:SDR family oxidoreductase [Aeromicrobium sp. Leaf350]